VQNRTERLSFLFSHKGSFPLNVKNWRSLYIFKIDSQIYFLIYFKSSLKLVFNIAICKKESFEKLKYLKIALIQILLTSDNKIILSPSLSLPSKGFNNA
tara:strand:+ start:1107 stop:1403 length:297 start_codon:yes stop_codon:yes gene_type:complete